MAPDIPTGTYTFSILAPISGAVLADAEVSRQDVRAARAVLRSRIWALSVTIFSAALLLAIGPLLSRRQTTSSTTEYVWLTLAVAIVVLALRSLVLGALSSVADAQPLDSPLNVLVTGLTATGLVALAVTAVERWRVVRRTPYALSESRARVVVLFFVVGAIGAAVVAAYERFLQRVVTLTHLDVLHFSLHPFDVPRFAVGGPGVPRLLHLGERKHRLTPGTLRGGAQQRGALCVSSLEPVPAQAPLGVLVVEQVNEPVRRGRVRCGHNVAWRAW